MSTPNLTRRNFLKTAAGGALVASTTGAISSMLSSTARAQAAGQNATGASPSSFRSKTIGALYFRAQLYTIVPRQVREDMEWMRDAGINTVVIGILEQDFTAARENMDILCAEAHRAGLKVWGIPSRWGNLVAGAMKVPCIFTGMNPECWVLRADGTPWMGSFGPYASVHHPVTLENYERMLGLMLTQWPIEGVIWDEPKAYNLIDHSLAAKRAFGGTIPTDVRVHRRAFAQFFAKMNFVVKKILPSCHTSMFTFCTLNDEQVADMIDQPGLDAFGCDGRPWAHADRGPDDSNRNALAKKCLIDDGPRFNRAARAAGRETFVLIENHALTADSNAIMERRLPEVLAMGWDNLLCYYYPRSCDEPDTSMAILRSELRKIRS